MAIKSIPLTLMVDKSCNRVVFAESDSHFVEILLSFLTLPLASLLRLANKPPLGSLRNLFDSVKKLDSHCFRSEACKSMLLRPLNSAAELLGFLPINYDNSTLPSPFLYTCNDRSCCFSGLSCYSNAHCECGKLMGRKLKIDSEAVSGNDQDCMFPRSSSSFIVTEELLVLQSSTDATFDLLAKLGISQGSSLESLIVDVTVERIHELLERLLISDTPLADVFLGGHREDILLSSKLSRCENPGAGDAPTSSRKISVKLFLNQEENKVLYAEGDKEFADLLVSFLTYPIGSVVNSLGGKSGIGCLDNLYASIGALKMANCFKKCFEHEMLLNPKLPLHFSLQNQLIRLNEQPKKERFYMCRLCVDDEVRPYPNLTCNSCLKSTNRRLTIADPKLSSDGDCGGGGYVTSSRFIVGDDLVVKQLSSVMVATELFKPGEGGNRRNVEIGEHEALRLLQTSISSKAVLTDAFLG